MSPFPLRLAIVGFGKLGLLHAALAAGMPDSKLVAVVEDSSFMRSALASLRPDLALYKNHHELLANPSSIDGVIIATPTEHHVGVAKDFIDKKIPVLIEKPLSLTSEEAAVLVTAHQNNQVPHLVGYMGRFVESFLLAKKIVSSGILGRNQSLKSSMYIGQVLSEGKGWRFKKKSAGGGVLITQNCHLIDLLHWIFGDIEWVSAHANKIYSREVEDSVHAYFKFKDGLTGWMDTSWSERGYRMLTMEVKLQAEFGSLRFNDDEVELFLEKAAGEYQAGLSVWKKPDLFESVSVDVAGPQYSRQLQVFTNSIRTGSIVEPNISSSYKVQKTIDAIYNSCQREGQVCRI